MNTKKCLKQRFLDYISGFAKNPGEYTDEELLTIGIAHQELQRADKNWIELAEVLGVNKTG